MPEIPSSDGHELLTKGFLREELARFRGDLRADIGCLADELSRSTGQAGACLGGLRGDLAAFERSFTRRVYAMLAAQTVVVGGVWLLS